MVICTEMCSSVKHHAVIHADLADDLSRTHQAKQRVGEDVALHAEFVCKISDR